MPEPRTRCFDPVVDAGTRLLILGSLDSNIRARDDNDLVALAASLPQLHTIAFNGGTAAKLGIKVRGEHAQRYRIVSLPSSSPAYTLAYAEKLQAWLSLRSG